MLHTAPPPGRSAHHHKGNFGFPLEIHPRAFSSVKPPPCTAALRRLTPFCSHSESFPHLDSCSAPTSRHQPRSRRELGPPRRSHITRVVPGSPWVSSDPGGGTRGCTAAVRPWLRLRGQKPSLLPPAATRAPRGVREAGGGDFPAGSSFLFALPAAPGQPPAHQVRVQPFKGFSHELGLSLASFLHQLRAQKVPGQSPRLQGWRQQPQGRRGLEQGGGGGVLCHLESFCSAGGLGNVQAAQEAAEPSLLSPGKGIFPLQQ